MNVTIVGVSSDIGYELGYRFLSDAARLQGTYRTNKPDSYGISMGTPWPNCASPYFLECDMTNPVHMVNAVDNFEPWDVLILCPGTMEPIGEFMSANPFEFKPSVMANAIGPLMFFNWFYKKRRPGASVCFFAGPNLAKPNTTYCAYAASKAYLTQAVKTINAEIPEKVFMLAPGLVKTKIHDQTLSAGQKAASYERALALMEDDPIEDTTPHDDIYACLRWCIEQPKEVVGGKVIHVVRDSWRAGYLKAA